jgi:hypothetical protein
MDRRDLKRIPVDIKIEFFCGTSLYHGILKNLSENSICISTKTHISSDEMRALLYIPHNEEVLCIHGKVGKIISKNIGDYLIVRLENPYKEYMEFIDFLKEKETEIKESLKKVPKPG